jgi:hypothetical protein
MNLFFPKVNVEKSNLFHWKLGLTAQRTKHMLMKKWMIGLILLLKDIFMKTVGLPRTICKTVE